MNPPDLKSAMHFVYPLLIPNIPSFHYSMDFPTVETSPLSEL